MALLSSPWTWKPEHSGHVGSPPFTSGDEDLLNRQMTLKPRVVVPLSQGLQAQTKTGVCLDSAFALLLSGTLSRNTLRHSVLLGGMLTGRAQGWSSIRELRQILPSPVPQYNSKLRDKSGSKNDMPGQDMGFLSFVSCILFDFVSEGTPPNEELWFLTNAYSPSTTTPTAQRIFPSPYEVPLCRFVVKLHPHTRGNCRYNFYSSFISTCPSLSFFPCFLLFC